MKKAGNEEVFKSWILGFQIDFPASIFGVGYSAFASAGERILAIANFRSEFDREHEHEQD